MSDKDEHTWEEINLNDNADVWDKEKPIEGVFVKMEDGIGPNESKMYTIKTNNGEVKVWGSMVLDDKLADIDPDSYIKIEYEGKVKGKKAEYHSYKVFIDRGYESDGLGSHDEPEPDSMPPDFLLPDEDKE